jgi:CRP/FNR family cyclic AMP-dependent transcriptional regulator
MARPRILQPVYRRTGHRQNADGRIAYEEMDLRARRRLGLAAGLQAGRHRADHTLNDNTTLGSSIGALAARGVVRRYRKGTVLIEEGDVGDTLYIILSGRVRVYTSGDRGREVTHGSYGPGDYVGEMSLDGGPRAASVATTEATTCAVVTRTTLQRFIADNPSFAFELLSKVIRRARAATLSAKQMALNDVYGRLVSLFDELSVEQPDGTKVVNERLTHQDAASRLGCSREMVSRLMKDLQRGGYIALREGRISVLTRLPERW